ncbi:MAG: PEP-CTERM sorting domain-containing protein [bacterium]|nr:PEP-CTERM sorting domain-containing protein [bacterium]
MERTCSLLLVMVCAGSAIPERATADAFTGYAPSGSFELPAGATEFGILPDGRLITVGGASVFVETAAGSGGFGLQGALFGADFPSFGPAFVRVSPDGLRVAVGSNGGSSFVDYRVGVFALADLTGDWHSAGHFDGRWYDDTHLALTAGEFGQPAMVTLLDTHSADPSDPVNPVIVNNIGGASAGIAFDAADNLYTGNGYAGAGPSGTGAVKYIDFADWSAARAGGGPADFENQGRLIVEVLSAGSLGFDPEGNLYVGGGDFGAGELDFAALVHSSAVADAIAGIGPADPLDPAEVRRFDPDDANDFNFYDLDYNDVTDTLYVREGRMVYTYVVPEPGSLGLLLCGGLMLRHRRRSARNRSADAHRGRRP